MNPNYNFFMKEDVSPYLDQWIAIVDSKIVSHGKDVRQVFEEARKRFPGKRPLVTKVPGKETMIL